MKTTPLQRRRRLHRHTATPAALRSKALQTLLRTHAKIFTSLHSTPPHPSFPLYAFFSFSVNSGTFSNRSPTSPTSATWKMGASPSLLIAAMTLLSFMPARC